RSTSFSVPFRVMPAFSARKDEAWIAGPSAIGSENGMPNSIRSAPASGRRCRSSNEVWASGSPAVMKGMNAARFFARSSANRFAMRLTRSLHPLRGHLRQRGRRESFLSSPLGGGGERSEPEGAVNACSYLFAQRRRGGEHVLIAATRKPEYDNLVLRQFGRHPHDVGDGVRGFERGDDAFQLAAQLESGERLGIGRRKIFHPARIAQPGMLGADARIIETRRNRMRLQHLAIVV